MSERANQQMLYTPAPGRTINATKAIEDVVPGQFKELGSSVLFSGQKKVRDRGRWP